MNYELLIQSKNTGNTVNYTTSAYGIELNDVFNSAPSSLTFTIIKTALASYNEGDQVRFSINGEVQFAGYVFSKSKNRYGQIFTTCYDQIRYLKAKDSYAFVGKTVGEIIQQIASDFQLKVGTLADTGYAIPVLVQENKECLDIINYAIQQTVINTGKLWRFYDDAGNLTLKEVKDMINQTVIGTKSLVTEYDYNTTIDEDVYNQIKLVRPNEDTGTTDVYIFKDSTTISVWGLLQLYEQVDENLNPAQIIEQGQTMLLYYNRVLRTLDVEMLGIIGLRAGNLLLAIIPDLGDIALNQFVLVTSVTHRYDNKKHDMSVSLRISLPQDL